MSPASQITWDDAKNPALQVKWDTVPAKYANPSEAIISGASPEQITSATQEQSKSSGIQPKKIVAGGNFENIDQKLAKLSPQQKENLESGSSMAIPITLLTLGTGLNNPVALGRSLIGGIIGSAGGSWLGGYGGEAFGNRKLGERIGGILGGLGGGIYGGLDKPVFGPWGARYSIGRMIPFLARDPELAAQERLGSFLNKGYKPAQDVIPDIPEEKPYGGLSKGTISRMKNYGNYDPFSEGNYSGKASNEQIGAREPYGSKALRQAKSTIPQGQQVTPTLGRGLRPSETERMATNLVRKPIVSPEEYATEQRLLGEKASIKSGEGTMGRQSRLLGTIRARRAARGMKEPQ